MHITEKAMQALRSQLIETYAKLGNWNSAGMDPSVKRMAESKLIKEISKAGIGYRIEELVRDNSNDTFNVSMGVRDADDVTINMNGIEFFCDPAVSKQINNYRLDYITEPEPHFAFVRDR